MIEHLFELFDGFVFDKGVNLVKGNVLKRGIDIEEISDLWPIWVRVKLVDTISFRFSYFLANNL